MYEIVYGAGTMFFLIGGLCVWFSSLIGDMEEGWKIKMIITGLAMFVIGGGLLDGIFPIFPPPESYSRTAIFDGRILVKGNGSWKKEIVVTEKNVVMKFTTDEKKVGRFEYNFLRWVEWRPATEDIKKILTVRGKDVYYLNKKGRIKKMKANFYKKYKK